MLKLEALTGRARSGKMRGRFFIDRSAEVASGFAAEEARRLASNKGEHQAFYVAAVEGWLVALPSRRELKFRSWTRSAY